MYGAVWKSYLVQIQGCQPHTSSNIENWWERGDRWRHNAQHMRSFLQKHMKKMLLESVTFDLIG